MSVNRKSIVVTTKSYGNHDTSLELRFYQKGEEVQLPLKDAGMITGDPNNWHQMFWAVDSANKCWYGKDFFMEPISADDLLLLNHSTYEEKCAINEALGRARPWPEWAIKAFTEGWAPPKDWTP